jgi:prolyl-tRNA editing enzyme YbaK/EbsC (Cys-tRNA(Pro) deacylase)
VDAGALVSSSLERLGVAHSATACDPAAADTAVFCERYGISPEDSANTILVAVKREPRRHVACVVLAATRLDVNHKLREVLGEKRLSFADADETVAVTGMLVGGVVPFGLPDTVPVLVDAAVMERPEIVLGGGGGDTIGGVRWTSASRAPSTCCGKRTFSLVELAARAIASLSRVP